MHGKKQVVGRTLEHLISGQFSAFSARDLGTDLTGVIRQVLDYCSQVKDENTPLVDKSYCESTLEPAARACLKFLETPKNEQSVSNP